MQHGLRPRPKNRAGSAIKGIIDLGLSRSHYADASEPKMCTIKCILSEDIGTRPLAIKEKRYFFAVGQKSFETGASSNHFSTVVPIADVNGEIIDDRQMEFPNRGRAWWMLRGEARVTHAPPGCLIMSGIEDAVDLSSAPDKDIYQLLQPALPGPKDLIEILTPGRDITDPNALLDDFRMRCDHEPTRHVLVQIGDYLYGPLKVELDRPENDRLIEPEIRFTKPVAPNMVYRIAAGDLEGRQGHIRHKVVVQRDASKPNDMIGHAVRYHAITGALYEDLREGAQEIDLVSLQDAVRQVSKDFLSRRERREFLDRLGRFAEEAQSSQTVMERVSGFLHGQRTELDVLDQIFDALLSDESFKPKIEQAAALEIEKRVDAQAAQIDARAKERIKELSTHLENLRADHAAETEKFEVEKARRHTALQEELIARERAAKQDLEEKWEELSLQEELISQSLEAVAERLASDRKGLLNDFLAIEPLLRRLGLWGAPKAERVSDLLCIGDLVHAS